MAKYYGAIGYAMYREDKDGVVREHIVERPCKGDLTRVQTQSESTEYQNDNINVSNTISIVADAFAYNHVASIKYITWLNAKWKVKNVQVDRPRLILQVGGVYNEQTPV